jgi:effector-binding domain-containing protein
VVERDPTPTLAMRGKVRGDQITERLTEVLPKAYEAAGEKAAGQPYAMWHDWSQEDGVTVYDMEIGAPVSEAIQGADEVVASQLPGGTTLEVTYRGAYEGLPEAYQTVQKWMTDHGYIPNGAPWDWYLDDPSVVERDQCRTLISWPVRRA